MALVVKLSPVSVLRTFVRTVACARTCSMMHGVSAPRRTLTVVTGQLLSLCASRLYNSCMIVLRWNTPLVSTSSRVWLFCQCFSQVLQCLYVPLCYNGRWFSRVFQCVYHPITLCYIDPAVFVISVSVRVYVCMYVTVTSNSPECFSLCNNLL